MALQFVAVETTTTGTPVTSFTIDVPGGVQDGDGLLLCVGHASDVSVITPTGWSLVRESGGGDGIHIYRRTANSEPSGYQVDLGSSFASAGMIAWRSTVGAVIVVDATAVATHPDETTAIVCPGVTTRRPNTVLHAFILISVNDTVTPDPGMTERWAIDPVAHYSYLMTEPVPDIGATGTRTATTANGFASKVISLALAELTPLPASGDVQILLDQYILTNQSHTAELITSNQPYETTTINAGGTTYEMVRGDATLRHAGYFSGVGAGYLEQEMEARLGASATVHTALLLGTSQPDCVGYVLPNNANFELVVSAPAKDVITVDGLWSQGTGLKRGKRFFDGLIDDLSDQDGIDLGAAGSDGGWAYLFVHEIFGGVTTATFDVESDSSDTFTGATVEGTFSVTAAGAYEIELSGTIGRYVRLVCTSLGGADAFEATAVIAVAGVTQ